MSDIYPGDHVIMRGGIKMQPPKYYDRMYGKEFPDEFEYLQFERETKGRKNYADNTTDRLKVKEIVTEAKLRYLKREMYDF